MNDYNVHYICCGSTHAIYTYLYMFLVKPESKQRVFKVGLQWICIRMHHSLYLCHMSS